MSLTSKHKSTARVVDGKLMLSCPDAVKPVVWQMDLADVKSSALEVEDNRIFMRTTDGKTVDVAEFTDRKKTVAALMQISKALESAQGRIAVGAGAQAAKSGGGFSWGGLLKIMIGLLLIFVLFKIWTGQKMPTPLSLQQAAQSGAMQEEQTSPPQESNGMPVDAGAYLNGQ